MKTSIRRQGTWIVVAALTGSSVLGLLAQGPQAPPYKPSRPIAIVGGLLIDATGAPARHDQTVIIEGERITRIGPMESVTVPAGAEVIDAAGMTDHAGPHQLQPAHPAQPDVPGADRPTCRSPVSRRGGRPTGPASRTGPGST